MSDNTKKEVKENDPIEVVLYTNSPSSSLAQSQLQANNTTKINVTVMSAMSDVMCLSRADVIIIESRSYLQIIKKIKVCNNNLKDIPVLLFLNSNKQPKDRNIPFIHSNESTPNVLLQLVRLMHMSHQNNRTVYDIVDTITEYSNESRIVTGKAIPKDIQDKYIPKLKKLQREIKTERNRNRRN